MSDLIDEKFYEEFVEAETEMQEISENSQKQLLPLEDFMSSKVKKK